MMEATERPTPIVFEKKDSSVEDGTESQGQVASSPSVSTTTSTEQSLGEKEESKDGENIVSPPPAELSPEEIKKRTEEALSLKEQGNAFFASKDYDAAIECYTKAIFTAPPNCPDCSIFYCNRAACHLFKTQYDEVINDCKSALELNPNYSKAYVRRGKAYENLNKYTDALADFNKALELDPKDAIANESIKRVEPLAKAQAEKEKAEMLSKLKDLGNMFLGKFGLSTDNFQFEKDPNTGNYSINFRK